MLVQVLDGLVQLLKVVDVAQDLLPATVDLLERRRDAPERVVEDEHLQLPWRRVGQGIGDGELGKLYRVGPVIIVDPDVTTTDKVQVAASESQLVSNTCIHGGNSLILLS